MKLRNLFLAGLALMSMTACSNDDDPIKDSPGEKATAYMQLSVTGVPTHATKTDGKKEEDASTAESKVTKLTVYLCNPSSYQVLETIDVTAFKGGSGNPVSYETEKFRITTSVSTNPSTPTKFAVFVLANDDGGMFSPATDITQTTKDGITGENIIKNNFAKADNFIMFNYCNGKDLVPKYTVDISTACTWDNPAQCKNINLDRLAVKIRSKQKSPGFTLDNSENKFNIKKFGGSFHTVLADHVTLKGFKLVNGATKVNLLQMWKEDASNNGVHPFHNTLLTPYMAAGDNTSGSAFYNNFLKFRTITKDGSVYKTVIDNYASVGYYNDSPSNPTGDIYCLENSSEGSGSTLYGNTTGLIYQFQVSGITDSDNKAGNNCFYDYNGTLYVSLAAIEANDATVFTRVGGSITDAGNLLTANNDSEFRTKYGIKVYRDGIMYYTYMIKDQNYVNNSDKPYYAVMRNTIYDLTVKSLTNIGTDVPGGWNPETEPDQPLDTKKVYMLVEVKVKPWVLSEEEITLK